jgi:hypothetical protein
MSHMFLAYFGPDTVMPLTSVLAAVVGIVLMSGRAAGLVVRRAAALVGLGRGSYPAGLAVRTARRKLRFDGAEAVTGGHLAPAGAHPADASRAAS